MKILKRNYFSSTASSIDVKLHNCYLVVMGNIGFKFQPDWSHGLAEGIIIIVIILIFESVFRDLNRT